MLLALNLLVYLISGVYFFRYLAKPNTGLVANYPEVVYSDGRVVFAPKSPFSPAVASGLIPYRDAIVSVRGQKIRNTRDILNADSGITSFEPFSIEVIRDQILRKNLTIAPVFNVFRIDWFFMLIFSVVLGFTSLYLSYHSTKNVPYIFMILASLSYLIFTCVKPFYYESLLSNSLIHFGKITIWFIVFFGLYFPDVRGSRLFRRTLIISVCALYIVFVSVRLSLFWRWSKTGSEAFLSSYRLFGKIANGVEGIAYLIYLFLISSAYFKSPHLREKRQLEWIIAGFMISLTPYFFFDQLTLILDSQPGFRLSLGSFANLFLIVFPLFLIIGLFKKTIFNFKFFLLRYFVYILIALMILFFYSTLYSPLVDFLLKNYGSDLRVAAFIVSLLLFLILFPIRTILVMFSERILYKDYYQNSLSRSQRLELKNRQLLLQIEEMRKRKVGLLQREKYLELRLLVGNIIKRFKKPMRKITGSLLELHHLIESSRALKEDGGTGTEMKPIVETLAVNSEELMNITDRLRTLSGLPIRKPANVDLGPLMRTAVSRFRARHPGVSIKHTGIQNKGVHATAQDILTAILLVLDNAYEAHPAGNITISGGPHRKTYVIEITDSGPGIPKPNLDKVFFPFFTTKDGHEGLGLYVAKTAIESNFGVIYVAQEKGGGTSIRIALPLSNERDH